MRVYKDFSNRNSPMIRICDICEEIIIDDPQLLHSSFFLVKDNLSQRMPLVKQIVRNIDLCSRCSNKTYDILKRWRINYRGQIMEEKKQCSLVETQLDK
jgi:hypothetical protein